MPADERRELAHHRLVLEGRFGPALSVRRTSISVFAMLQSTIQLMGKIAREVVIHQRIIDIRTLAALDMAGLGAVVILVEYFLGIVLPFGLGLVSLRQGGVPTTDPVSWPGILGLWLLAISANYVPLFLYAVRLKRTNRVDIEGRPAMANARRYGLQQIIILLPFAVVLLALLQERQRRRR
jgi:hypothetical protein